MAAGALGEAKSFGNTDQPNRARVWGPSTKARDAASATPLAPPRPGGDHRDSKHNYPCKHAMEIELTDKQSTYSPHRMPIGLTPVQTRNETNRAAIPLPRLPVGLTPGFDTHGHTIAHINPLRAPPVPDHGDE